MGLGGISVTSLIIILLIVILLFGTKRIRTIGKDLGSALKSFRDGMQEDDKKNDTQSQKEAKKSEPERNKE